MIFTFYSYKGGVGRSMAVANIAHWLFLRGVNVVLVDWDLEAPGLENFFYQSEAHLEHARAQRGVIDLLSSYKRQAPHLTAAQMVENLPPLSDCILEITPEVVYPTPTLDEPPPLPRGRLSLLTAGWRSGARFIEYAETVQQFDWAEFYSRHRGEDYFNWFRSQLLSLGDVVLIDSRTGVSEMSGVCTRQLADVVVVPCAPNAQNLQGTIDMVKSFVSPDVRQARGNRTLEVLIFPSRVDDSDSIGHREFRSLFQSTVEEFTPKVLKDWRRQSWDLEIPYKAQYSYRESLVTAVQGANEKLDTAYRKLAAHLALLSDQGGPLWRACERELRGLAADAGKEWTDASWLRTIEEIGRWPSGDRTAARTVLSRLVRLSPQAANLDMRRRASLEDFPESAGDIVKKLIEAGAVSAITEGDSGVQFELANEGLLKNWTDLKAWITEDRPFLLWRQDLEDRVARWQASNDDATQLWRGILPGELETSKKRRDELTDRERRFIDASLNLEAAERAEAERQARDAAAEREQQVTAATLAERAQNEYRLALRITASTRMMAAVLVVALIGALAWLEWTASRDASQPPRPDRAAAITAARERLEKSQSRVDAIDAPVKKKSSRQPSRRGQPTLRSLRAQIAYFQQLEAVGRETTISGIQVAIGVLAVIGLGGAILTIVAGVRRGLQRGHGQNAVNLTDDLAGDPADPLGSPALARPTVLASVSVWLLIAIQATGLVFAVVLWNHPLAFKVVWCVAAAGGAYSLFLASIYTVGRPAAELTR